MRERITAALVLLDESRIVEIRDSGSKRRCLDCFKLWPVFSSFAIFQKIEFCKIKKYILKGSKRNANLVKLFERQTRKLELSWYLRQPLNNNFVFFLLLSTLYSKRTLLGSRTNGGKKPLWKLVAWLTLQRDRIKRGVFVDE